MTDQNADYESGVRQQSLEDRVAPWIVHEMKFADHHKDAILDGEKTLTVRLSEEWRSLTGNDGLRILDEDGNHYADAVVKRAGTFEAQDAYHIANYHDGHASYGGIMVFANEMGAYYPDEEIVPSTEMKVVHFGVVDRV